MRLIVGLGNPGEKFIGTRHNLGFVVINEYARKHNLADFQLEKKFKAEIIKVSNAALSPDNPEFILARPQTFMNLSGLAAAAIANFYKIASEDIIIIHDELDLPLGKIKVRLGGAGAGHHGVESIIDRLGSDKFVRIRLGIGNKHTQLGEHKQASFSAEHFVVEPFTEHEVSDVKRLQKKGLQALEIILNKGLEQAQNQFN